MTIDYGRQTMDTILYYGWATFTYRYYTYTVLLVQAAQLQLTPYVHYEKKLQTVKKMNFALQLILIQPICH